MVAGVLGVAAVGVGVAGRLVGAGGATSWRAAGCCASTASPSRRRRAAATIGAARRHPVADLRRRLLPHRHRHLGAGDRAPGLAAAHPRDGRPRAGADLRRPHRPRAHRGLGDARLREQRGRRRTGRQRLVERRTHRRPAAPRSGVRAGADCVLQTSEDGWTCATPLTALTDDRDAMLAVAMNGEPLPLEHGFPVRTVVPGLYGYVSATKWVVDLEVTRFDGRRGLLDRAGLVRAGAGEDRRRASTYPARAPRRPPAPSTSAGSPGSSTPASRRSRSPLDGGAWQPVRARRDARPRTPGCSGRAPSTATPGDHRPAGAGDRPRRRACRPARSRTSCPTARPGGTPWSSRVRDGRAPVAGAGRERVAASWMTYAVPPDWR